MTRAGDYARVFEQAQRAGGPFFTVLSRRGADPGGRSRLGLAISRKQLRRAVDRNRIKRLVREFFRTEILPAGDPPRDYVVMARAAARGASNAELRAALAKQFARVRRERSDRESRGDGGQ